MQKTAEIKCAQLISIEIGNEIIQGKQKEMLSMRLFLREPKPLIGHHNFNLAADLVASRPVVGLVVVLMDIVAPASLEEVEERQLEDQKELKAEKNK